MAMNPVQSHGTLLVDGDCGFCMKAAGLAAKMNPRATITTWQDADLTRLEVSPDRAAAALQYVGSDRRGEGSDAIALFLIDAGRGIAWLGRALLLPGIRSVARPAYRWVAAHRYQLPGGTPACALDPTDAHRV